MAIVLYYHPFSRAATLSDARGSRRRIRPALVDIMAAHRIARVAGTEPDGQAAHLTAGEASSPRVRPSRCISAIGMRGPPRANARRPQRGAYLRWAFFTPSVMEPPLRRARRAASSRPGRGLGQLRRHAGGHHVGNRKGALPARRAVLDGGRSGRRTLRSSSCSR